MSTNCKNWVPGVPPAGLNGADLDATSVKNAAISGVATTKLQGTVTNAQLAGSITNDKLSKPYALAYIPFELATPAAQTGVRTALMPYAGVVLKGVAAYRTAPTAGSTVIDVHVGATYASHHSVFGAGTKIRPGLTSLKSTSATASGTLGTFSAGHYLRVDVDGVASGTKADINGFVVIKHLLQT
jgi:hypothetical protein